MGSLAVARAFGDIDFKFPYNKSEGDYVSAEPHVYKHQITPEDEFLIVSCDGLWDKMKYETAIDYVIEKRKEGLNVTEVAQGLVKLALERGSMDNVTCILIFLNPMKVVEERVRGKTLSTPVVQQQPQENKSSIVLTKKDSSEMDLFDFLKLDPEEEKKRNQTESKRLAILTHFKLQDKENVLKEFQCSLQTKVLHNGIMLITDNFICFAGHLFTKKVFIKIPIREIESIEKHKSLLVYHSLRIITQDNTKYLFSWKQNSLRDDAFRQLIYLFDQTGSNVKQKEDDSVIEENELDETPPSKHTVSSTPISDEEVKKEGVSLPKQDSSSSSSDDEDGGNFSRF